MNIRKADIFFTASEFTPIGEIIQFFTRGRWTHCALIDNWPWIISADAGGIVKREIQKSELYSYDVLSCPSLINNQRTDIVEWTSDRIGEGYDFGGLFSFLLNVDCQNKEKYFCSELIFLAYKHVGVELQKRIDQAWVSPRDIWTSPLLEVVPHD